MKVYKLRNYNPIFGFSIQRFDGRWGLYFDLGHSTAVIEMGREDTEY